jgi:D-alanyl-D-alanine carboxypeptidase (penicillin-binding protein 5/6)
MSANNIADMLAVWAYGSMDAYVAAANDFVAKHGIDTMTIADASGFSPKTIATAVDLVRAGELLMDDPLLTGIVKQKSLTIPGVGAVPSTNVLLGDDVVGIKTGNTDEAGGCYVIAATHTVDGSESITIVAAVMGAKDVPSAMRSARSIAQDARSGFASRTIVAANDRVATYKLPWGTDVQAVVRDDLRVVLWLPRPVDTEVSLSTVNDSVAAGQALGTVSVHGQSAEVVAEAAVPPPPLLWRAYFRYF